jgi:hypothetical protein
MDGSLSILRGQVIDAFIIYALLTAAVQVGLIEQSKTLLIENMYYSIGKSVVCPHFHFLLSCHSR